MKIDTNLVQSLIDAQFPHWANLAIRPVDYDGWDNRTFRLGDALAVRLPSAAHYAPQVVKEQRWMPSLATKLPLPIPVPVALGRPCGDYPWNWSIYRWLVGQPASIVDVSDGNSLATSLGEFLYALQSIEVSGGPCPGPENFHRGGNLRIYDDETRSAIDLLNGSLDGAVATEIWERALAVSHQGPPVWVHGDISLSNLLVRNGKLSAVIDFGCAAIGDPACDLAIAFTSFGPDQRNAFRSVLPFDVSTWARARGWALWKSLIVSAGITRADPATKKESAIVLKSLLTNGFA